MKILLVTQTYKDSFPPRNLSMGSAVKQASQLSGIHEVAVLTTGRQLPVEQKPNLTIYSVPGLLLPDPINYVISFQLLFRFITLARKLRPDVVLVSKFMFFSSLVIPLARLLGLRVVTTTDTFPGVNWFPRSRIVGLAMWIYARIIGLPLLWLSHKVILLYSRLQPIADHYRINSVVIPNGVEEQLLQKLPLPKSIHKQKKEFWVGFVGRSESVKGYDIALKTATLLESNPRIKFIFIGGNQRESSTKNKLFLGFKPDVYSYYQLFDVLILPSLSEGLPNVVMEAMAQRVVVIANPVGGVIDLISDGNTGFLVKTNRPEAFAQRIIALFDNAKVCKRVGAAAHRHISKHYAWPNILRLYTRFLQT